MENSVIIAIVAGIVILIAVLGGLYMSGIFSSGETPIATTSCQVTKSAPFVPRYRLNDFSCRDPVNVPGSILRGTLQKCEESCDNIPACVGFDRRADVGNDQEAFCYLQMSNCGEADVGKKLSADQDGNKWKRHIKP